MKQGVLTLFVIVFPLFSMVRAQSDAPSEFYNPDKIQNIDIQFYQSNWANLLDSLRFNGDGLLLANVKINGQQFDNAGVRYQYSKTWQPGQKRNALFIKLNYIDQEQNIEGHTSLNLSVALRDPSMIREVLSYEIARQYFPTPHANFAQVMINDANYGLLVNVETIDKPFLEKHFGDSKGPLFLPRTNDAYDNFPADCKKNIYGSLENEKNITCFFYNYDLLLQEEGWDDLIELTRILEEDPESIHTVLNVDRALWMLAFNNVLVNLSSYSGQHSQHFYLYKDAAGQFNPIIYNLNLSFGSLKNIGTGSDLKLRQLQTLDPLLHLNNPTKPLISKLLENEWYKKIYLAHMQTIVADHFKDNQYRDRANDLQRMIQVAISNDPNKSYTFDEFNRSLTETIGKRSQIPGIVELMEKRVDFLRKDVNLAVIGPKIENAKVTERQKFSNLRVETFQISASVDKFPKRVKLMYRLGDEQNFKEALMYDDGGHNDGAAGDGVYGVTIVPQGGEMTLSYYIIAENAAIVSFSPENYMWKQYEVTLDELNK